VSTRRLIAAVGIAAIVLVATPPLRDAAAGVWQRGVSVVDLDDISVRRHLGLWAVASRIALAHPLTGIGQETFPDVFPQYANSVLGADGVRTFEGVRPESPHNVYLAIAVGAGLPALAAYLAIVGAAIATIVRTIKMRRSGWTRVGLAAVLAAIGGHLVTDAFMTAELTSSWLFWILMGAGVAIARQEARRTLDGGRSLSSNYSAQVPK
jgi:O-antigen ligase